MEASGVASFAGAILVGWLLTLDYLVLAPSKENAFRTEYCDLLEEATKTVGSQCRISQLTAQSVIVRTVLYYPPGQLEPGGVPPDKFAQFLESDAPSLFTTAFLASYSNPENAQAVTVLHVSPPPPPTSPPPPIPAQPPLSPPSPPPPNPPPPPPAPPCGNAPGESASRYPNL